MLLSFGYGVFHAAGPGHGKAVISAWLLATENELKRGILISFMSAIIQALTAIVLVSVLFLVVASVGSTARNVAGVLESASYAPDRRCMGALPGLDGAAACSAGEAPHRCSARLCGHHHAAVHRLHHFDELRAAEDQSAAPITCTAPTAAAAMRIVPDASDLRATGPSPRPSRSPSRSASGPAPGPSSFSSSPMGWGSTGRASLSTFAMAVGTFITVSVIAAIAVYSQEAGGPADARQLPPSRLARLRPAASAAALPLPFSEPSCSSARWAPPTP